MNPMSSFDQLRVHFKCLVDAVYTQKPESEIKRRVDCIHSVIGLCEVEATRGTPDPDLGKFEPIQKFRLSNTERDITRREIAVVMLDRIMARETVYFGDWMPFSLSDLAGSAAREAWAYTDSLLAHEHDPVEQP